MDSGIAAEMRLLRGLVKVAGRLPQEFRLLKDRARVHVFGRGATASYPRQAWTSGLMRDLYRGYFDARPFASGALQMRTA